VGRFTRPATLTQAQTDFLRGAAFKAAWGNFERKTENHSWRLHMFSCEAIYAESVVLYGLSYDEFLSWVRFLEQHPY
jgi:hypothetical protein